MAKLNKPLFTKLIKELQKEPLLYRQENYTSRVYAKSGLLSDRARERSTRYKIGQDLIKGCEIKSAIKRLLEVKPEDTTCKTACCIAGRVAVMVHGEGNITTDVFSEAKVRDKSGRVERLFDNSAQLLGIDENAARVLFTSFPQDSWPNPWCKRWAIAITKYSESDIGELKKLRQAQVRIACSLLTAVRDKGPSVLFAD